MLVKALQGHLLSATRTHSISLSDDIVMEQHMFTRQLQRCKNVPERTSYLKMLLCTVCSYARMVFVHSFVSNHGPEIG